MAEAEQLDDQEEHEPTVDEIAEEIVNSVSKKEVNSLVSTIQKQDDIIATAAENKKAAYQALVNKGCSKKTLEHYVKMQTKPPASNARATATLRALEEITGQSDLFLVK